MEFGDETVTEEGRQKEDGVWAEGRLVEWMKDGIPREREDVLGAVKEGGRNPRLQSSRWLTLHRCASDGHCVLC